MAFSREIEAQEEKMAKGSSWIGMLVFVAAALGILCVAAFVYRDLMISAIAGVVVAMAVGALVRVIRASAGTAAFGAVPLRLAEPLPAIGGRLVARASLPESVTRDGSVFARLECQMVTYGNENERKEVALWRQKKAYGVAPGRGADLEVRFDLPTNLPAATDSDTAQKVTAHGYGAWELTLAAQLQGTVFERTYSIPVQPAAPGTFPAARPATKPELLVEFIPGAVRAEAPTPAAAATSEAGADQTSAWVLVAVNLVPLAGLVWLGWQLYDVVFLYWIETLIVGAFNVLRMLCARTADGALAARRSDVIAGKIMFTAFFLVHFGGFCYLNGDLLAGLFPPAPVAESRLVHAIKTTTDHASGLMAVIAIVASHGYSFLHNYIGKGEYRNADSKLLMLQPYRRIVVTSLFIFLGGMLMARLGEPIGGMVAFVLLKTGSDLWHHRRERARLSRRE